MQTRSQLNELEQNSKSQTLNRIEDLGFLVLIQNRSHMYVMKNKNKKRAIRNNVVFDSISISTMIEINQERTFPIGINKSKSSKR